MKTKNTVINLLLVVILILPLAACGRKSSSKDKAPTASPTPLTLDLEPRITHVPITPMPGFSAPDPGCEIAFPTEERYHYDMDLTLDSVHRTVSGHVVLDFFNDSEDAWDKLCLRDYSSQYKDAVTAGYSVFRFTTNGALTEITGVTDGRDNTALTITRDEDVSVVWVPLAKPLAPGENMRLTYDFTATIPTVKDRYGAQTGIFNVTNFYPILAEYADGEWSRYPYFQTGECFYSEIADYHVKLTVPSKYTVVSTGTETEKKTAGDTTVYTLDAPCVRDFVFCAGDTFGLATKEVEGVRVNVFYNKLLHTEAQTENACEKCFEAAEESFAAFGEAFGRYPYEELDIVLAEIEAGGMEYPNLVIITDWMFFTENPDERLFYSYEAQIIIAHEIGHQWFMGIVGSNSGEEPWLDESFASYTESVYNAYRMRLDHTPYYRSLTPHELTPGKDFPLNRGYFDFGNDETYVHAIYALGAEVLNELEDILGEENFHAVIREYVRRNAFKNAETADFFEVLFSCCGTENAEINELLEIAFDLP